MKSWRLICERIANHTPDIPETSRHGRGHLGRRRPVLGRSGAQRRKGRSVARRALVSSHAALGPDEHHRNRTVNLTNAGTWRQPVHELIPIGPFEVRVKAPADVRGRRARLLVSGKTIAANRTAGQCRFAIKSILDHEVVVIG